MEQISVELPLPHINLSPNSRCHWRQKAQSVASYRSSALLVARMKKPPGAPWKSATVRLVFTFRDKRRRDKDNLLASMKSAFDGIADAGIVENDSGMTYLPIEILPPDKFNAFVKITVTKVE